MAAPEAGRRRAGKKGTTDVSPMTEKYVNIDLIVTVTKGETQAVFQAFSTQPNRARLFIDGRIYYNLGVHGDAQTFLVQSEMGIGGPGAALLTVQQAIQDLHPQAVILCGIAYGLRPNKQKLGDILISKQLAYYEPQKVDLKQGIIPRGDRTTCSERLLQRARSLELDWKGAPLHFGLVLSGEKLVNDPSFRKKLLNEEPEAIGGEMEGAGLYAAARASKTDWILIKAICDWADGKKDNSAQEAAAANAANCVLRILEIGTSLPDQQNIPEPIQK
jgi:nucleoside phosphorylase